MVFRTINANDTENFFQMMCRLDEETDYMMYEPGERQERTKDLTRLTGIIEAAESGGVYCSALQMKTGRLSGLSGQNGAN